MERMVTIVAAFHRSGVSERRKAWLTRIRAEMLKRKSYGEAAACVSIVKDIAIILIEMVKLIS